jgi:serine/threonine protein kinase
MQKIIEFSLKCNQEFINQLPETMNLGHFLSFFSEGHQVIGKGRYSFVTTEENSAEKKVSYYLPYSLTYFGDRWHVIKLRFSTEGKMAGTYGEGKFTKPILNLDLQNLWLKKDGTHNFVFSDTDWRGFKKKSIKLEDPATCNDPSKKNNLIARYDRYCTLYSNEASIVMELFHFSTCLRRRQTKGGTLVFEYIMPRVLGVLPHIRLRNGAGIQNILTMGKNLFKAVMSLHSKGYVHGDIRPINFLVTENDDVNLIDFGRSRKIGAFAERQSCMYPVQGYEQAKKLNLLTLTNLGKDDVAGDLLSACFVLRGLIGEAKKRNPLEFDPNSLKKNQALIELSKIIIYVTSFNEKTFKKQKISGGQTYGWIQVNFNRSDLPLILEKLNLALASLNPQAAASQSAASSSSSSFNSNFFPTSPKQLSLVESSVSIQHVSPGKGKIGGMFAQAQLQTPGKSAVSPSKCITPTQLVTPEEEESAPETTVGSPSKLASVNKGEITKENEGNLISEFYRKENGYKQRKLGDDPFLEPKDEKFADQKLTLSSFSSTNH